MDEEMRVFSAMKEVQDLLQEGREQEAAGLLPLYFGTTGKWRMANVLFVLLDSFHDQSILFRCIIDTYVCDGYNFPKSVMMHAKKIAPQIPASERLMELPDGDPVTVYRATKDPIDKARNGISWTTNKNVAIWFAYRFAKFREPLHVYSGAIKRDKIIAYTNDRNEFEVIQHRNVKVTDELHPTLDDVQRAMEWKCSGHPKEYCL